jgi:hypothetical protein
MLDPSEGLTGDKFVERFGLDALKFVNSPQGKQLRLRGLNARIVQPGLIHVGDRVRRVTAAGLSPHGSANAAT